MTDQAQALEKKHHFQVYNRYPITIDRGLGARVWDIKGNEYIDALGGIAVNNLGHCHPKVVHAIQAQAERLMHVSNFYYTEMQSEFLRLLSEVSGMDRVFLCNSGVEAMEAAVKLARKWGHSKGKTGSIISLGNGFHGRSVTTITMGKPVYQEGFAPLPPGFEQVPFNDFEALKAVANEHTVAITFEPIQGSGGLSIISQEFMTNVRALCDELDILLIIDEVQTGVGRTGKFWGFEHYGIRPDIIAAAKALAGGIPVGAIMANEEIAGTLSFGQHGTTFGGNPLVAAAGVATLNAIKDEKIVESAAEKGAYMLNLIKEKTAHLDVVVDVRGMGLMIGVELSIPPRPVVERMFEKKILSNAASGNVIRLVPPLVISKEDIDRVVDVMVSCIQD